MKTTFITAACSTFAALASAAPTDNSAFEVAITFWGADGSSFSQNFPADDSTHAITNQLSITKISSVGGGFCTFQGIDGSSTVVVGEVTVPVSPPQTQVSGTCDIL
ncbi:hypothetical protein CBS63078_2234 [Aspergillus niger]|uniref:Uncharacterized protein n=5 Tax=Aspergillus TaxID=5052 RepID=A0A3F3PVT0_9EURO|nr:hypothetical protein ANI_1_1548064 [Aspergillus niger CBS 513.88]XP_026623997.1 hypothetical protein BDQ94DRAFT_147831 [Aspergillus welwitschiae]EHA23784.1 hypothetical protein ASPNIDRAFT_40157 [Aspergillus niger ATCC 1015]KAI2814577.1 hypothetical protein CBS115989_8435 [Aspergillus niger]RDH16722.1 hypothetical protein M747DRAFT_298530 [Aspergillus niger ATCC 13496]RDK38116.1 hypothetical protein M752DRAFT_339094 [Aspergillus phoenicis ATCC 13157]KAI2832063.1 hypothetical protein CBS1338|eukprot:XP_003188727.1 hypothetical protein ANI_1_1548064 [Aspergillus niger CBS 513.88]